MKKYLAFFLLLSVTALVYGRPQKLVIKTDKESVELRYWPLDGKQLPFYSLYSPVIVTCRQMTEIELPCNETIYKISLGKGKTSLVYGEFYQFNLSSCIRQQNSLTAQFVSFSLSNLANIFYPPQFLQ